MPELPEVTALAADLDARLTGRVVDRLDVLAFPALKTYDPPVSALSGGTVSGVTRRGKFLDLAMLDADGAELHLVIHLARAGWVRWREAAPKASGRPGSGPLAARLVLRAHAAGGGAERTGAGGGGEGAGAGDGVEGADAGSGVDITEAGTRKSLALHVVRDPQQVERVATLGPEPLDDAFTEEVFADILTRAGRAQIKGVLRDQRQIAGIGNAYSDEILHTAKMSPYKPARMPPDDVHRLYVALRTTLAEAVARTAGVAASDLKGEKKANLRVHGRFGEPCPVCGDTVKQVIYADSTFQYCPTCQTGGKPLSDRVLDRLLK